ncbi:MAG: DUF1801 domain-containing protein [Amphritea sp.]
MQLDVQLKFASYPDEMRELLMQIRNTILIVAKEDSIGEVVESLKGGEPSYSAKDGSAVRMDWKPKYPDQYFIYFNCKTRLIETFKEMYGSLFTYEGNRAIVFKISERVPLAELKHCISLSLRYHKIKHLPLLGA